MTLDAETGWETSVPLPGTFPLPVEKLLFSCQKPQVNNFFGDGVEAYVVEVDPDKLQWFMDTMTRDPWQWSKGRFLKGHMEEYEWILEWMNAKEREKLDQVIDLDALIAKDNIVHCRQVKRNSSGAISNASIWILDPENNTVVYVCSDT